MIHEYSYIKTGRVQFEMGVVLYLEIVMSLMGVFSQHALIQRQQQHRNLSHPETLHRHNVWC